jgi:hypothetical protein
MLAEPTPEATDKTPKPKPDARQEEQSRAETPDFIKAMGASVAAEDRELLQRRIREEYSALTNREAAATAQSRSTKDSHVTKAYSRGEEAECSGDHRLATGTPPPDSEELDLSAEMRSQMDSPDPSTEYGEGENDLAAGRTIGPNYRSGTIHRLDEHHHRRADGALIYTLKGDSDALDSQTVQGHRYAQDSRSFLPKDSRSFLPLC